MDRELANLFGIAGTKRQRAFGKSFLPRGVMIFRGTGRIVQEGTHKNKVPPPTSQVSPITQVAERRDTVIIDTRGSNLKSSKKFGAGPLTVVAYRPKLQVDIE